MTSLRRFLPQPKKIVPPSIEPLSISKSNSVVSVYSTAPPYGERKGWVPRTQEDFNDGGAYPEIWVPQYPLEMGMKKAKTSNALAVQVDATGKIKYDVLLKQGQNKDKIIYSKITDLLPSEVLDENDPELQRPDEEEIKKITEETKLQLEKITQTKISAAMPVKKAEKVAPPQYIRYTPSQQGVCFNSGAKQRIIRMVEIQRDPMEPPRFKTNKKIPRGPPSPPVPVMHSPTRKVTVKEQQEWRIPPCISNWKNAKGYTIPLDKRLAADGRGMQQTHINENFSKLAEALYIADRKAREAVEARAQVEKKVAQKEKEKKEEHLRQLAQKAREERAGIKKHQPTEDEEARERDQLRYERHKERQRERNIARAAPDKRSKLEKQRERDISEQIALGLPTKTTSNEVVFDQRLFNQNKGMDSGFGDEDDYAVYDKPWRGSQNMKETLYRPRVNKDNDIYGDDVNKFATAKEFTGADFDARRDGPVQFEKEDDDPFGLAKFLTEAKKSSKRAHDDSDPSGSSSKRRP